MTNKLPYIVLPGSIKKILLKVQDAKTPDRFTQDFLATKLGFRGGNYRQFIPLAKKLGLLNSDGKPTDLYRKFRNDQSSKAAMAVAIQTAYKELFVRNEYAYSLDKTGFKGLVVEITDLEKGDRVVKLICNTFDALKEFANFEEKISTTNEAEESPTKATKGNKTPCSGGDSLSEIGISYDIKLVLPNTDDPAVFNAIFKALKENLLKK